ncbi:flavodoxin-dependent (E)-4-hydroxy-3-methylbut-2-enyl-diphosphate synthase [Halocella sp. SP3-1]|uniref:flavodoxin-dependent (E)-4-hydroxy-3-methylbut-2-enyl-diphosphate synthase n=1 Tax=Halocella sp. SP3-1 TaxID=2382161 RepID=UPI000F74C27F|nr:flavodoxin-dependent (E)-4-hydroxy-3-methylbut-2-enyl-diphosphate synthase [Halocella sp. SP3-1]AZO95548.1 flavodoxin-dependent (E)-4-hydroxy-3-methylbut-2-enyl-diphosphate synthase [Halocella sp. SP3-1]
MINYQRRKTHQVFYGDVPVGGDAPISVQSMTNTKTADIDKTVKQIEELVVAGCEIIRVAVPDMKTASCLSRLRERIKIPLIADIHFDYKLALEAVKQGVDGLRLNPGNIGDFDHLKRVAQKAKEAGIPIRIGVNSGSLEKKLLKKYGSVTAEAMVESALSHISLLEENGFNDIVVSLKSTDIWMTLKAYSLLAKEVDYPFHIGITEAGTVWSGTIKSALGLGSILTAGLGDTVRVSLTGSPVEEVRVGWQILRLLDLRQRGPKIISCPTCGRTNINLIKLAEDVEKAVKDLDKSITIAVMGCVVNGPGEAREADIGIAGGKNEGLIFKKGKLVKKVKEDRLLKELLLEIDKM